MIAMKDLLSVRARLETRLGFLESRLNEIRRLLREPEDDDLEIPLKTIADVQAFMALPAATTWIECANVAA